MTYNLEQGNTMPEKKIRAGAVSATIWNNKSKNTEGEYKTVTFERSYKDAKGDWQTTHSLRVNDIPKAELVLRKAFEFCQLGEAA